MSGTTTVHPRHDDLIGVIGVLVILLGTATNSALAMLVISLIGLSFIGGYYCGKLAGRTPLLVLAITLSAALIGVLVVHLF